MACMVYQNTLKNCVVLYSKNLILQQIVLKFVVYSKNFDFMASCNVLFTVRILNFTASCNKGLDSTNCTDHHDNVYCKNCHGKLFGPKGYGFAAGASGLSMDTGNPNEVTKQ